MNKKIMAVFCLTLLIVPAVVVIATNVNPSYIPDEIIISNRSTKTDYIIVGEEADDIEIFQIEVTPQSIALKDNEEARAVRELKFSERNRTAVNDIEMIYVFEDKKPVLVIEKDTIGNDYDKLLELSGRSNTKEEDSSQEEHETGIMTFLKSDDVIYISEIDIIRTTKDALRKNSFDQQTSMYALGIEQLTNQHSPNYFLILAINKFNNTSRDYNLPAQHIRLVERDDILSRTAMLKAVHMHSTMASIIAEPRMYLELFDLQRIPRETKYFQHPVTHCEVLYTGSACINFSEEHGSSNMCDVIRKYILDGFDLRDILIDGFEPWKGYLN